MHKIAIIIIIADILLTMADMIFFAISFLKIRFIIGLVEFHLNVSQLRHWWFFIIIFSSSTIKIVST